MSRIIFLAIGDELLRGESREGNGFELISRLEDRGLRLEQMQVVRDDRAAIAAVIQRERALKSLLILSGGLGPTDDDFTRSAVAEAVGVPVERDPEQAQALRARYAAMGRSYADQNDRQADRPEGAHWLENPVGTAPGFWFPFAEGGGVVSLPGVPSEFRKLLDLHLDVLLRYCGIQAQRVPETTFKIFGIPESEMQGVIGVLPHYPRVLMRSLPAFPEIRLKIAQKGSDQAGYEAALQEIRTALDWRIFTEREERSHGDEVLDLLRARGWRLVLRESLEASGGQVAALLAEAELRSSAAPVLVAYSGQRLATDPRPPGSERSVAGALELPLVDLETRELPVLPDGRPQVEIAWSISSSRSDEGAARVQGSEIVSFPVFKGSRHRVLVAHSALRRLRLLAAQ